MNRVTGLQTWVPRLAPAHADATGDAGGARFTARPTGRRKRRTGGRPAVARVPRASHAPEPRRSPSHAWPWPQGVTCSPELHWGRYGSLAVPDAEALLSGAGRKDGWLPGVTRAAQHWARPPCSSALGRSSASPLNSCGLLLTTGLGRSKRSSCNALPTKT